jgi:hypothetical protein
MRTLILAALIAALAVPAGCGHAVDTRRSGGEETGAALVTAGPAIAQDEMRRHDP